MDIDFLRRYLKQRYLREKMRRGRFLFCVLLCSCFVCQAQTLISPMWTDRGMVLRDQLWNLSVTSIQGPFNGRLEVVVSDASSGVQVFSGAGKVIIINKGTNILSALGVYPVNYSVLTSGYNYNPAVNSLIPPGVFNVCYKLYRYTNESAEIEAVECKVLESDPLTPPTLVLPENEQAINSRKPFFTWLPPMPNSSLPGLNYSIKLVEKGTLQSPQEAVERNHSIFSQVRIAKPAVAYSNSLPDLDTGKIYAWQIISYNDNSYVAASECWTFSLATSGLSSNKPTGYFIPMISSGSSQILNVTGEVKFIYNNESADSSLTLMMKKQNAKGEGVQAGKLPMQLSAGVNNISIRVDDLGTLQRNVIYELYFLNSRQERWWITFRIL